MSRGFSVGQCTYSIASAVKNTFIHLPVEDIELPRSASDPPRWKPGEEGELEGHLAELAAKCFESDVVNKLDFDSDSMNKVELSVDGARLLSTQSVATSAGSTNASYSDGYQSVTEQSVGYAADDSANEMSTSDRDLDSRTRVRDRGPLMASWEDGVTTVMIRQVPRQCTQWKLLTEVNSRGFEGFFDYIYVPFDFKKGVNVGYGFMNFVEPKYAEAFRDAFDGRFLDHQMVHKNKPLRVHPATMQGYDANLQHFLQTKTGQHQDPQFSPLFRPRTQTSGATRLAQGKASQSAPLAGWVTIDCMGAQSPQRQAAQATPSSRGGFCHACGIPHSTLDNFCANCGTRLEHRTFATQPKVFST